MDKSQITLTRSEAKEIRNHLYQSASDLSLLSQLVRGGLSKSLLAESKILQSIAKAINDRIQTEVTFPLTL